MNEIFHSQHNKINKNTGTGNCYPCMANKNRTYCGPPPSYCNKTWDEDHCPTKQWTPAAQITSWMTISTNETQIAAALIAYGPLVMCCNSKITIFFFFKSKIWVYFGFIWFYFFCCFVCLFVCLCSFFT